MAEALGASGVTKAGGGCLPGLESLLPCAHRKCSLLSFSSTPSGVLLLPLGSCSSLQISAEGSAWWPPGFSCKKQGLQEPVQGQVVREASPARHREG